MSKFRNYDKYEVYPDGKIWSYKSKKFLKPQINKDGYQQVWLYDNEGNRKLYYLHRVIYESVTGKPIPSGMQINHRSEVKDENFFANLELMTCKENINWGTGNNRRSKSQGKQVGAFKNNELVMTFHSTNEAQRQGFYHSAVSNCCNGKRKTHKGYEWHYIETKKET